MYDRVNKIGNTNITDHRSHESKARRSPYDIVEVAENTEFAAVVQETVEHR